MANRDKRVLASNLAANGADTPWQGGKTAFIGEATFGGGSVKLSLKTDQGTYIDISTLSANGMNVLDLPPGTYRATIATATAVFASLVHVPIY